VEGEGLSMFGPGELDTDAPLYFALPGMGIAGIISQDESSEWNCQD
jgi:hypothetical protein